MTERARPVRRPWRDAVVLVCRECDGGPGLRPKRVRSTLKRAAKRQLPRKAVRVLAVSCLDACPKDATTVAVAGAGETAVRVRTAGELDTLVADLAEAVDRAHQASPAGGARHDPSARRDPRGGPG